MQLQAAGPGGPAGLALAQPSPSTQSLPSPSDDLTGASQRSARSVLDLMLLPPDITEVINSEMQSNKLSAQLAAAQSRMTNLLGERSEVGCRLLRSASPTR